MEKKKLTDFEEYIHDKIISIYGNNLEKKDGEHIMGSLKIPSNVLKLINNHNFAKNLSHQNFSDSYIRSQEFYNNLMISLQKNEKILKDCCRITTAYNHPNRETSNNNESFTKTHVYSQRDFESIDKKEFLFSKDVDFTKEELFLLKNRIRPFSTKNTNKQPILFDNLQNKHITRIRSAKSFHKLEKKKKNPKRKTEQFGFIQNPIKTNTFNESLNSSNSKLKKFQLNEKFPAWTLERSDFQQTLHYPEFNINSKILKICEKQYFKRSVYDKNLITFYLKKIKFFQNFLDLTLETMALKLESKFFVANQIIFSQDEIGDSLIIIYEGEIHAIHGEKILARFKKNDILSRHCFNNEKKTFCSLKTKTDVWALILRILEYEPIFKNLICNELISFTKFLMSIPIIKMLEEHKLQELIRNLSVKTYFKHEIIFRKGEYSDTFYIVKGGTLKKNLLIYLENKYKWPMGVHQWFLKKIVTTIKYPIRFTKRNFVGFEEFVSSSVGRKETLEVEEDCLLLELNKSKFNEIFEGKCLTLFKEYYNKELLSWEEDAQKNLKDEDEMLNNKIVYLKNAVKGVSKDSVSKQKKLNEWLNFFNQKATLAKQNREIIAINKFEKETISKYEI